MASPTRRPFTRLLVANRGEIATRIINAAREHETPLTVFAVVSPSDAGHTLSLPPGQVLHLPAANDYVNISLLISLVKQHRIEAIHPGYGFLSESAEFAQRMWDEANAVVVGPGPEILARTGDKLAARALAEGCHVPVLPAMVKPTGRVEDVRAFVDSVGLPVMIKAVDGGGGRGIRLVEKSNDLDSLFDRAVAESPSRQVFVEKAAISGYRHIEVQIIGDGSGAVAHLWERECSIQRRYQKIVEVAPSHARQYDDGNTFVASVIDAAVRMAVQVRYLSLGTFEFLANPSTRDFFFLEVNPRLQVEHTITEQISLVDIVATQFSLAQGKSLADCGGRCLDSLAQRPPLETATEAPSLHSIQLRLTAEDPQKSFSLSIGKIKSFSLPSGNGIRVDTSLVAGQAYAVSADFDSLLAKIIVTGDSWSTVTRKARRALEDTRIDVVKTNLDVLRAIVASHEFTQGTCDTQWLEKNIDQLTEHGEALSREFSSRPIMHSSASSNETGLSGMSSSAVLLRKGDAWNVNLEPQSAGDSQILPATHFLKVNRILRNEFPSLLAAEIEYSMPGSKEPRQLRLTASTASASASGALDPSIRKGNPSEAGHVIVPFPGKLVEVLVDEGDHVQPGQVVCVIKQMKMELEVRAKEQQRGTVLWVTEVEDGADVAEGMLIAELDTSGESQMMAKL